MNKPNISLMLTYTMPPESMMRAEFERQHIGRDLTRHGLRGTYLSPAISALWKQHMRTAEWFVGLRNSDLARPEFDEPRETFERDGVMRPIVYAGDRFSDADILKGVARLARDTGKTVRISWNPDHGECNVDIGRATYGGPNFKHLIYSVMCGQGLVAHTMARPKSIDNKE